MAVFIIAAGIAYNTFHDVGRLLVLRFDKGDMLGTAGDVYHIFIGALVVVVVNIIIAKTLYHRDRLMAWVVSAVTVGLMGALLVWTIILVLNN